MSGDRAARRRHPAPMRAKKRFGQHFLEPAWVDKVVRAIDPRADDTFIEIGPGRGALTRPLSARVKRIIAYEIDRDLARDLRANAPANVDVIEGDFLKSAAPSPQLPVPLRAAGNLPYNAASPILFKLVALFESGVPLSDATVMLQREVADRLLAPPGTKEYGVLTVLIRHLARVERLLHLPAGAFRPAPKVLSSVVRLSFHPPDPPVNDRTQFAALVQAAFTHRRKTIVNALHAARNATGSRPADGPPRKLMLPDWLDGARRPETLSIAEFARLADALSGWPGAVL